MNNNELKPYIRRLYPTDESQFIELLLSVYERSYSYHDLYEQGVFSSLLDSGKLISYGEFTAAHRLVSHTGFWVKESNNDYVESGISFRQPHTNQAADTVETQREWQNVLSSLSGNYRFIHQQCTTWHTLAQRYARKFMRAQACGIIINYVENERLNGIKTHSKNMHGLMMTTVLTPIAAHHVKTIYVPDPLLAWIEWAYLNVGLPIQARACETSPGVPYSFNMHLIEDNPAIQLQRRRITLAENDSEPMQAIKNLSPCKTDLLHVPMESKQLMAALYPLLIRAGYFPCGIRPHQHQEDELIFQHIKPYQKQLDDWLSDMKIACKLTKLWLEQWQTLVQQTLSTDC